MDKNAEKKNFIWKWYLLRNLPHIFLETRVLCKCLSCINILRTLNCAIWWHKVERTVNLKPVWTEYRGVCFKNSSPPPSPLPGASGNNFGDLGEKTENLEMKRQVFSSFSYFYLKMFYFPLKIISVYKILKKKHT